MQHYGAALGHWVIAHRLRVIVVSLLLVGCVGTGLPRLGFDNDTRAFFSDGNPQLAALDALENIYSTDESVLFILHPDRGHVFTRDTLAAIETLTAASWRLPHSTRVDSVTNFQHIRADGDEIVVEDLVRHAVGLSDAELQHVERVALREPLLLDRLVSPSGETTAVHVNIVLPEGSRNAVEVVAAHATALAANLRAQHPSLHIYTGGMVMMDSAFGEAGRRDMGTLAPAILVVLLVIAGIALRSVPATIATLAVILAGMITGLGCAGWLAIKLTPASVAAPTIILTLGVADSIHILVTMLQELRRGRAKNEAIVAALRENLDAVFLTSLTTAIGFLSMNLSDAPPFRDLGNIVAIGVMATFGFSTTLLPALMAALPLSIPARLEQETSAPLDGLARFVTRRHRAVLWSSAGALVILTTGAYRIELNDDWIRYFGPRYEVRRATDFMEQHLTGAFTIQYSLDAGEPGGVHSPTYLAKVDELATWFRMQPKVVHVSTIADTMKRLNRTMHGDEQSFYRIPDRQDLAAQYLLLYELSLPYGLDLNDQINIDKSATRMTVTLKDTNTSELRAIDERAQGWLATNAPETMRTQGSGLSMVWAHLSARNIRSMLVASGIALVLISVLLIVAFRSLTLGLVSLIPNLAPATMGFGIWGLIVGNVGLGLSVIVSMTLGIVVDDTIHFLSTYLHARRADGRTPPDAIRHAFDTVGTAMLITTVALVAGFLVLTFSDYRMSAHTGLMSAITVSLALAMDFFLLPALLLHMDRAPERRVPGRRRSALELPAIRRALPAHRLPLAADRNAPRRSDYTS